jgi:hypothetical protein
VRSAARTASAQPVTSRLTNQARRVGSHRPPPHDYRSQTIRSDERGS